jgi:hypothetical protein
MARTHGSVSRLAYQCFFSDPEKPELAFFRQGAAAERWLNHYRRIDGRRSVVLFRDGESFGSLEYEPGDCVHLRSE